MIRRISKVCDTKYVIKIAFLHKVVSTRSRLVHEAFRNMVPENQGNIMENNMANDVLHFGAALMIVIA